MLKTDVDALNGEIHNFEEGPKFLWDSTLYVFGTYITGSAEQLFTVYYGGIFEVLS